MGIPREMLRFARLSYGLALFAPFPDPDVDVDRAEGMNRVPQTVEAEKKIKCRMQVTSD